MPLLYAIIVYYLFLVVLNLTENSWKIHVLVK